MSPISPLFLMRGRLLGLNGDTLHPESTKEHTRIEHSRLFKGLSLFGFVPIYPRCRAFSAGSCQELLLDSDELLESSCDELLESSCDELLIEDELLG